MKKFLTLLTVILLVSCSKDDNSVEPKNQTKLVSKIVISQEDYKRPEESGTEYMNFTYDNEKRLIGAKIYSGLGTDGILKGKINFTYSANRIDFTAIDEDDKDTTIGYMITDNQGRVVFEDDDSNEEKLRMTYIDNFLTQSKSEAPGDNSVNYFTWENENMTQLKWGGENIEKLTYGTALNNASVNMDINLLFYSNFEGLAFCLGGVGVSNLFDIYGNRSKNYITEIKDSYSKDVLSYQFNEDGTPSVIEINRYSIGNNEHLSKSTYTILYQ